MRKRFSLPSLLGKVSPCCPHLSGDKIALWQKKTTRTCLDSYCLRLTTKVQSESWERNKERMAYCLRFTTTFILTVREVERGRERARMANIASREHENVVYFMLSSVRPPFISMHRQRPSVVHIDWMVEGRERGGRKRENGFLPAAGRHADTGPREFLPSFLPAFLSAPLAVHSLLRSKLQQEGH